MAPSRVEHIKAPNRSFNRRANGLRGLVFGAHVGWLPVNSALAGLWVIDAGAIIVARLGVIPFLVAHAVGCPAKSRNL